MRIISSILSFILGFSLMAATTAVAEEAEDLSSDWIRTVSVPYLIPTEANPTTTPVVWFQSAWVPEESPEGGHPDGWADNSPTYSDDWMLQVNDSTHTIQWIAPPENDPTQSDIELGA